MILKRLFSSSSSHLSQSTIYFGENSLNRLSFLRKDPIFIANALTSPYSKIIFLNNSNPIVKDNQLYTSNYSQVDYKFRQVLDSWINSNSKSSNPPLLCHFLGLSNKHYSPFKYKQYSGIPFFAIELQDHNLSSITSEPLLELKTREEINTHLSNHDASIISQAKMYLNWLQSTKHCQGCGSSTIPIHAGSELLCSSSSQVKCPVKTAPVSNASFPRLDPVLITCVVHNDHVLFTRNSKFPKGMYTCIAGFIEPGESIENAVRREVWEESGLQIDKVEIVQSQPWPFPTNIMIGCIGYVTENQNEIELNHDDELQDAQWVHFSKLRELITNGEENKDLVVMIDGFSMGIPNDNTLAYQLYKYAVDHIYCS